MNLFQSKKNLLLLVSSVIVWLGTCLLAMHWNTVYDGAIGGFPTYQGCSRRLRSFSTFL
ncbi:MAG: hypothetical protein ACLRIO_04955 [Butyricicoccus sp.]